MNSKRILISKAFRKYIKNVKKHFDERDIVENIKGFIRLGFRKGESKLTTETFGAIAIDIVKLRIRVQRASGRYLVGIIGETEYLPIFIDLKTGYYGKNMSFDANKRVVSMLETAFKNTLNDYLEHNEENPRLTQYSILD